MKIYMQKKTNRMSGGARCLGALLLCALVFVQPGRVRAADDVSAAFDSLADTRATTHNWKLARDYERQMRYELARQHYLLALASCRSEPSQTQLRRELESVDLQIRTMR
ncbi:MAG: hypothetical protein FWG59_00650 [Betaproteobacteria bacterium]|nr:hypothetical protein [Betaproteobacteria bacterium]